MGTNGVILAITIDTINILRSIQKHKTARYNQISKDYVTKYTGSLVRRLRKLWLLGFIERHEVKVYYNVYYTLTHKGKTLLKACEHLS